MDEFNLPINHSDLEDSESNGYHVNTSNADMSSLTPSEVSDRLTDISRAFRSTGALAIRDNQVFDTLYGCARDFAELDDDSVLQAWNIVLGGVQAAAASIAAAATESMVASEQTEWRSGAKQLCLLMTWMMQTAESQGACRRTQAETAAAGTKKKKATTAAAAAVSRGVDWDAQLGRALAILTQMLNANLSRIWNMGVVDEEFSNLFSRTANQLLEAPSHVRNKTTRDAIFTVLATLVQRYGHSMSVATATIHMLPLFEHLASPLAHLLSRCASAPFNATTIIGEVVREIGRLPAEDFSRDTTGTRNIASFLTELAEIQPAHMLPCIPHLLPLLDGDSYAMRNALLGVLTQVLKNTLTTKVDDDNDEADDDDKQHTDDDTDEQEDKEEMRRERRAARDEFLAVLCERVHDCHAFVRSRVLQHWYQLCEARAIPLTLQSTIVDLTIGRVRDKSSAVRKSALALLTALMVHNPYGAELNERTFERLYTAETTKLEEMEKSASESSESSDTTPVTPVEAQKIVVKYYSDALEFARRLDGTVAAVSQLLGSKVASDVLEAIDFFVSASRFKISSALVGVRKMLVLLWSKEPAIKSAAIDAYRTLYCADAEVKVAKNLIALTMGASLSELTSLEELVANLIDKGDIQPPVIRRLWDVVLLRAQNTQPQHARAALMIIGMAASADSDIIAGSNTAVLAETAFGERGRNDLAFARIACTVLQKLAPAKRERGSLAPPPSRKSTDDPLFVSLEQLVVDTVTSDGNDVWFGLAEQAVDTVYRLAEHPDRVCGRIIARIHQAVLGGDTATACRSTLLARLLFIVGHVALKQLVHCEVISGELKRRRAVKEAMQGGKKAAQRQKKGGESSIEDDMGVAAAQEDAEAEYIANVCENELVTGREGLLAMYGELVVHVCTQPEVYASATLRASATLCLCKFMTASAQYCEAHLRLLFTVLQRAREATIRSNIVIALGDLAFRFPNLVEPWTGHVYARLRDADVGVRKNTLMMLTHLILNDMIKVRGQISAMAVCLEDPDARVVSMARLFFFEFARKGNAVYNILPDVISRMSHEEHGVDENAFRRIIGYLLGFIQKDRQSEALIEKLCHRFRACTASRQWRDIAFCLSQLTYPDKCVKKLIDNFSCYQDKLGDVDVFAAFTLILGKARKLSKPEGRLALDELEQRIAKCHEEGAVALASEDKAARALAKTSSSKRERFMEVAAVAREQERVEMEARKEEEEEARRGREEEEKSALKAAKKKEAEKKKKKKAVMVVEEEESEDEDFVEDDDEEVENTVQITTVTAKSKASKAKETTSGVRSKPRGRAATAKAK